MKQQNRVIEEGEYDQIRSSDRHMQERMSHSPEHYDTRTREPHKTRTRSRSPRYNRSPRDTRSLTRSRTRSISPSPARNRSRSPPAQNTNRKIEKKYTEYASDSDFSSDSD